jgi:hypothetical protein
VVAAADVGLAANAAMAAEGTACCSPFTHTHTHTHRMTEQKKMQDILNSENSFCNPYFLNYKD